MDYSSEISERSTVHRPNAPPSQSTLFTIPHPTPMWGLFIGTCHGYPYHHSTSLISDFKVRFRGKDHLVHLGGLYNFAPSHVMFISNSNLLLRKLACVCLFSYHTTLKNRSLYKTRSEWAIILHHACI